MKVITITTAFALLASALHAQANAVPAPMTVITKLPSSDFGFAGGPVGSDGGNLVYYATNTEIKVYNRTTKAFAVVAKGSYENLTVSAAGTWLAATRAGEGSSSGPGQAKYLWTIPVNPRTGGATGEPRRVSMLAAESPAFSPDGKSIAFVATGAPARLTVIPSTGGAERVVVDRISPDLGAPLAPVQWSPDGKWIYYAQAGRDKSLPMGLMRVKATGGAPVPAIAGGGQGIVALDGQHLVKVAGFSPSGITVGILDNDGTPLGSTAIQIDTSLGVPCAFGWSGRGLKILAAMFAGGASLHAKPVASGPDRTIPSSEGFRGPFMSPDGTKIAMMKTTDTTGDLHLIIMNADGSHQRIVQPLKPATIGQDLNWSPDSKYVAFRTNQRKAFYLADVATGIATRIGTAENRVGEARWAADSRSLMYVRMDGTDTKARLSVRRTSPDGDDRLVRDVSSEIPAEGERYYQVSWFLGDSALLNIRLGLVMPVAGGPTVKLYDPIKITNDATVPAVSDDGRWVAIPAADGRSFQVVSRDGSMHRTIAMPGSAVIDNKEALFHPDNRTLVIPAKATPTTPPVIYLVPIDGGAPRALVTLPVGATLGDYSISSDGRTLLYTRFELGGITLVEADLGVGLTSKPSGNH